ncbi:hypothetical protein U1Q18_032969 [Sarracenia purpurea var. burkii]
MIEEHYFCKGASVGYFHGAIEYRRPSVAAVGLSERYLDQKLEHLSEVADVNLKLAAAEEALALSLWTTATICRALSLESKILYNVWRTTSELWDAVTEKRIDLQELRLELKLYSVLNEQVRSFLTIA